MPLEGFETESDARHPTLAIVADDGHGRVGERHERFLVAVLASGIVANFDPVHRAVRSRQNLDTRRPGVRPRNSNVHGFPASSSLDEAVVSVSDVGDSVVVVVLDDGVVDLASETDVLDEDLSSSKIQFDSTLAHAVDYGLGRAADRRRATLGRGAGRERSSFALREAMLHAAKNSSNRIIARLDVEVVHGHETAAALVLEDDREERFLLDNLAAGFSGGRQDIAFDFGGRSPGSAFEGRVRGLSQALGEAPAFQVVEQGANRLPASMAAEDR
mmetsp:Transcript_6574/g.17164  ORF Transcript_6574/g.17164 Transcript_6574/m.17164 type:complete len:273 (-) Transcript_6574:7-825(-)